MNSNKKGDVDIGFLTTETGKIVLVLLILITLLVIVIIFFGPALTKIIRRFDFW